MAKAVAGQQAKQSRECLRPRESFDAGLGNAELLALHPWKYHSLPTLVHLEEVSSQRNVQGRCCDRAVEGDLSYARYGVWFEEACSTSSS